MRSILDALKIAFEKFGDDIAGVIVEPVAGNMGVVPPIEGFLQGLRDITTEYGALLIFDEVMTGFRVGYHCAQGYLGCDTRFNLLRKSYRWRTTCRCLVVKKKSWYI